MAASIDSTEPQIHEPHAIDGDSPTPGAASEVTDYTGIVYYLENDSLRWNGLTDVGTQVVITYSFTDTADLPDPSSDPYGATAYWSYNTAQRTLFEEVTAQYEAVSGVIFVEIQGEAMINVYGSTGGSAGGWANVAQSSTFSTGSGDLTNNYMNMDEGDYGYQVNLHELGHAMGLEHPFEGDIQLAESVDNQTNTVMTYNIESPYVTELGVFDIQALADIYGSADSFNNWVVGVDANDIVMITATNGANVILATGQDTAIFAGKGNDEVLGREGDDSVRAGQGEDSIVGGRGSDTLLGEAGNDLIIGDMTQDDFSGDNTDRDKILGGRGDDTLYGGDGRDRLSGGQDDDLLYGGYGNDVLAGGSGNDTLAGGDGRDQLRGGAGNDVFLFLSADAFETNTVLDFTSGEDILDIADLGFSSLSQLTVQTSGGDTTLSYSNWFDLELKNFTGTLTDSDFNFI